MYFSLIQTEIRETARKKKNIYLVDLFTTEESRIKDQMVVFNTIPRILRVILEGADVLLNFCEI